MTVQKTPEEQLADAEAQAEKDFEAGWAKAHEAEATSTVEEGTADEDAEVFEEETSPEETEESEPDPLEARLKRQDDRLRNIDGKIGGMLNKIDSLATTAQAAPAQDDAESTPDVKDLDMEDYEELTPLRDQTVSNREKIEKIEQKSAQDLKDARELGKVDEKHPGWEERVATREFLDYALEEGPSSDDYMNVNVLLEEAKTNPASQVKADQILSGWQTTHSSWWKKRGLNIFSSRASHLNELLDGYEERQEKSPTNNEGDTPSPKERADAAQAKRRRRLAGNRTPKSAGGNASSTLLSDQGAFEKGFNKVNKANTVR